MNAFIFTFNVTNFDIESEQQIEQLVWDFGDIYASEIDGQVTLTFASSITVESRIDFVLDAIGFLNGLNPAVEVLSIDHDLVGTSDIASRAKCDRETVRKWVNSLRGSGDFPTPIGRINGGRKIWDWSTVNEWLKAKGHFDSKVSGLTRDEFARLDALIRTRTWERVLENRPFSLNLAGWPVVSSEVLKIFTTQHESLVIGLANSSLDWHSAGLGKYKFDNRNLEAEMWEEIA